MGVRKSRYRPEAYLYVPAAVYEYCGSVGAGASAFCSGECGGMTRRWRSAVGRVMAAYRGRAWAGVAVLALLLGAALAAPPALGQPAGRGVEVVMVYEVGSGSLSVGEAAELLGLYDDSVARGLGGAGGFRACFSLASPDADIAGLAAPPGVSVECWGSLCPSLIGEDGLRSLFVKVRAAIVCAGDARLTVTVKGGLARASLALRDYVFISFSEPWFTGNYTAITVTHPAGGLEASVYFGSGDELVLEGSTDAGRVDLSLLVKEGPGDGWAALYHHSPLASLTLNGTAHPLAVVVYVNASDAGYTGRAVYWWGKTIRVEDPDHYQDILDMAASLAEQWNASLKLLGDDTIVVEAGALQAILQADHAPWWRPTLHNVTEHAGAATITSGYGAVLVNGQLYLVDPETLAGSPIELKYTVNGTLAILDELSIQAQAGPAAPTLVDPPLIPDILLYTLNITGAAVPGPHLLKLASVTVKPTPTGGAETQPPSQQTDSQAQHGEPTPEDGPDAPLLLALAALAAAALAAYRLIKP